MKGNENYDQQQNYYQTVVTFQKKMAEITDEYNTTMTRAAPYRGSEAYRKIETDATAKRDADILALKQACWPRFQSIISDMRTAAASRPMIPPTPSQEAILRTLQMRTTLTVDELKMAENSLKSCPIALSVLDDIANAHNIHRVVVRSELSSADIAGHIDALERSAQNLLSGGNARLERERADMAELLTEYGAFAYSVTADEWGRQSAAVPVDTVAKFSEIVDGEGVDA